jgi:hypothetical protein
MIHLVEYLFGLMKDGRKKKAVNINRRRKPSFESLENRRLLAIMWANEPVTSGPDDPNFDIYGPNEQSARAAVKRAIADWNNVILDQNFDLDSNPATNNFELNVIAADLSITPPVSNPNTRGATRIDEFSDDMIRKGVRTIYS